MAEVRESSSVSVLDGDGHRLRRPRADLAHHDRRRSTSARASPPTRRRWAACCWPGCPTPSSTPTSRSAELQRALAAHGHVDAALRTELRRVRAQGWAIVDQELEEGLRSVAAPVRDRERRRWWPRSTSPRTRAAPRSSDAPRPAAAAAGDRGADRGRRPRRLIRREALGMSRPVARIGGADLPAGHQPAHGLRQPAAAGDRHPPRPRPLRRGRGAAHHPARGPARCAGAGGAAPRPAPPDRAHPRGLRAADRRGRGRAWRGRAWRRCSLGSLLAGAAIAFAQVAAAGAHPRPLQAHRGPAHGRDVGRHHAERSRLLRAGRAARAPARRQLAGVAGRVGGPRRWSPRRRGCRARCATTPRSSAARPCRCGGSRWPGRWRCSSPCSRWRSTARWPGCPRSCATTATTRAPPGGSPPWPRSSSSPPRSSSRSWPRGAPARAHCWPASSASPSPA